MREIKFRAWDFKKGRMLLGHELYERLTWSYGTELPNELHLHNGAPYIAYMQYTGLKDKNGVEAYQDDLYQPWGDDRIYQIVWDEDNACFKLKQVTGARWPCDIMMIPYSDGGVIGNLYENPELLESPKEDPLQGGK